ncbi:MAG TPA: hypothetical protein VHL11_00290 [Phototrophicaceae bacterium]|nr:hypothetical protein [Phototrophicaceae bacterium]
MQIFISASPTAVTAALSLTYPPPLFIPATAVCGGHLRRTKFSLTRLKGSLGKFKHLL